MPMNKTCGTCGHGTQKVVACDDSGLYPTERKACDKWIECTDSLEQLVLDTLIFAKCLMNTAEATDSRFEDYEAEYCGEQARFIDIDTSLHLRAHALGVEVSQ